MRYIHELTECVGINKSLALDHCPIQFKGRNRVNILALGDVGTTMLIGLRLLGGEYISDIGIMDIRRENLERLEIEMNQVGYAFGEEDLPPVHICTEEDLFDCDMLVFCASKGVPPVNEGSKEYKDVRMAQLDANREIIQHYASLAKKSVFRGMVAVVSDPVDNLATAFLDASGLEAYQVQGFGLGVMNMRALYYSKRLGRDHPGSERAFSLYETEGRAFGPHGKDLVIANSIENYDDTASRILTEYTTNCNVRVRELGFKPYIAPALSSAAIPLIQTLNGSWHYSSVYMGTKSKGAFLGIRNRMTENGIEYEDICVPEELFERILQSYKTLCDLR